MRDWKNKRAKLHQATYVGKLLEEQGMLECDAVDTPMDPGTAKAMMLLPTEVVDVKVLKQYQSLVGGLMWLLKTRPDMMFTINLLSRFLRDATPAHLKLARGRPLRYLKGTMTHGLVFEPGSGEWKLRASGDADFGGDLKGGKTTTGHAAMVGKYGALACKSKLERKICSSTGHSETYAAVAICKEVVWLRGLMAELGYAQAEPTVVASDNAGVVSQSTKVINHTAAKHYRIAQAYIRDLVAQLMVIVVGRGTLDNESDIFTKALGRALYIKHKLEIMGPQDVEASSM